MCSQDAGDIFDTTWDKFRPKVQPFRQIFTRDICKVLVEILKNMPVTSKKVPMTKISYFFPLKVLGDSFIRIPKVRLKQEKKTFFTSQ